MPRYDDDTSKFPTPANFILGKQMKIYNPSLLNLAHFKGPVIVSVPHLCVAA